MRSYKDDLRIDEHNLETEWKQQSRIYMYWAEQEAEAQMVRDKLQRKLNVTHAEMDAKIRGAPKTYGIDKLSEPAIKNTILKTKEYREIELQLIEANKELKLFSGAVTGCEHKKRALSKLTDLWIAGYYGDSRGKKDDKRVQQMDDKRKQKGDSNT
jgi:hypothetical protein